MALCRSERRSEMTNEQKFKSAPERREAYTQYVERCKKQT